jgi:glutamate synthase domain-containing protein 3
MSIVDFEAMDDADQIELYELVLEHARRTSSTVAQRVLNQWETLLPAFVKVMPKDYRRVLNEQAARAQLAEG